MFLGQAAPRNYLRRTLAVAGALGVLAYLFASGIEGPRGFIAAARLRAGNAAKAALLAEKEAERAYLDRRVKALDPQHLDLDMLGEQARRTLFFSEEGEVVITPPKGRAP